ncbi:MAG TPA: DedA family protein [Myxococcota bacterium]|jgi:membrane protein DedA with SNARE-associated domain
MPLEAWITHYGYAATALGGAFESETVLLLAGLIAHRGLLDLRFVIALAALGMFSTNQVLFHTGRIHGPALLARWPRLKPRATRVLELAHRHHRSVLLLYHFAVGVRAMTPFVLGMSGVRPLRFALVDASMTLLWIAAFTGAGFWLGDALEGWLPELHRVEHLVVGALAALGALGWVARRVWNRRRRPER